MARVLCVGHRPGLVRAAQRIDVELALLHAKAARFEGTSRRMPAMEPVEDWIEVATTWHRERAFDAVFAATEASVPIAADLRSALGVPGLGPAAALRTSDKLEMKRAIRAAGLACADCEPVDARTDAAALVERLGLPLVLKQRRSSGSRGLAVAQSLPEVATALARFAPQEGLAESFVTGIEMSVETLLHAAGCFHNPTEYLVRLHANVVPAALDEEERARIEAFTRSVHAALGIERGITHLELFRRGGELVLGEIATRPPGGRLMRLLALAYRCDPWELALRIELGETPALPARARRCAGVWVLHPGAGLLREVRGLEAGAAVPGIRRVHCRVRAGDRIGPRVGSGQDVGWIEAVGPSRDAVAQSLSAAHAALCFEFEPEDSHGG